MCLRRNEHLRHLSGPRRPWALSPKVFFATNGRPVYSSSRRSQPKRFCGVPSRRGVFTEGTEYSSQDEPERKFPIFKTMSGQTQFVAETLLPTRNGLFRLRGYRHSVDGWKTVSEPTAIICGDVEGCGEIPVRVHDACFTSEVLGSMKCDCAQQLELAMTYIQEHSPGMVIYLQQEGRGIGLANKIAVYAVQESGLDTVDANVSLGFPIDCREYTTVANILKDLNVQNIKLMTNNPRKVRLLEELGIKIVERIPCLVQPGMFNQSYLETKEKRMDHVLNGSWCYWDHRGDKAEP